MSEQRTYPRRRTRLRSGKLTSLSDRFLTECAIFDVSDGGIGMIVPERLDLPEELIVYDDRDKTLAEVRVCWRKGRQMGVAFEIPPTPVRLFHAQRLRRLQFARYAVDPDDRGDPSSGV
ncbi:PilZ domain-containing protein [Roseibium aestuarii]|uniref:PilZ domain-containing protein n=1 Tax=Roseibium aestuarii TaxID=2600299 RepID=A0ABW4JTD0_9HYPH